MTDRPGPLRACPCLAPRRLRAALADLFDEVGELGGVRSAAELADELSDIAWALGRLLAGLVGRTYVPVPFDGRHRAKISERMAAHGCVRSPRHLRDGACPHAPSASARPD